MKAADLRKAILQYAVEGKLVPQDNQDEPASILYDKIIKEKETLIKQGKIKKEKPLPPITDDEIPYEIPENWKWVRLGDLTAHFDGAIKRGPFGSAIKKDIFVPYSINTYKIYEQGNAIRKTIDYGNYFITENDYKRLENFKVLAGDILISCAGTLGETYILPENAYPGIINQALLKITLNQNIINKKFFLIIFKTITQNEIRKSSIGSAMKNMLSVSWLKSEVFFPLPPLKEQERIVKKVDELMALCDKLEQEEEKLLVLDKNFMENLPKSILQYAVEGKLVLQDIYDEPASLLYDKIIKEKENLIKQGKIKKEKPLPPITDDEIPYNIPENWKWARLGEMCNLLNGNKITNTNLPLLNAKYLRTRQERQMYTEGIKVNKHDYIILVDGENSGEVFRAFEDGILGSTFKILNINSNLYNNYILYILYFYKDTFKKSKKGAAIPHLDKELFKNILIPLPPLKEQERIVEKVDELLTYCIKLKDII